MGLTLSILELETQWRAIPAEEEPQAEDLIARAIATIRILIPSIDARVDADPNLLKVAQGVVIDMIKRSLGVNSDGQQVSSRMDVAGPYTTQLTFKTPSGNLYLLDSELALLLPRGGSRVGTIFTPPLRHR